MSVLTHRIVKQIFKARPEYRGIKTFIETGTYHARTIRNMVGVFDELHTIELSRKLYSKAVEQYDDNGINFHHGHSTILLPQLVESIDGPIFFYLDAHGFNDPDVSDGFPLWGELDYIKTRMEADIVAIDDVATFGCTGKGLSPEWAHLSIKEIVRRLGGNYGKEVFGNVLVIYRLEARLEGTGLQNQH